MAQTTLPVPDQGRLTLGTLDDPGALEAQLQATFGVDSLSVIIDETLVDESERIVVRGHVEGTLLGVEALALVAGAWTVSDTEIGVALDLRPDADWRLGTSFPDAGHGALGEVAFTDPQLVFSTHAELPDLGQDLALSEDALAGAPGLTFIGEVDVPGTVPTLAPFFDLFSLEVSVPLSGPILDPAGQTTFDLEAPIGELGAAFPPGADSGFRVSFGPPPYVRLSLSEGDEEASRCVARVAFGFKLEIGEDILRLEAEAPQASGSFVIDILVDANPDDPESSGTLTAGDIVSALLGGADAPALVNDVVAPLSSVGLRSGRVSISTETGAIETIELLIGTEDAIDLFGPFRLSEATLEVELTSPGGAGSETYLNFEASLELGPKIALDVSYEYPDMIVAGTLSPVDPLGLDDLLAGVGLSLPPAVLDALPTFELVELSFEADVDDKIYNLDVEVDADLRLFGRDLLEIRDTRLVANYDGSDPDSPATKSLDISGELYLFGLWSTLELHLESGASTGTVAVQDVRLGEIMKWMVRLVRPTLEFDLPSPWDDLFDLNLGDFTITFDLAEKTIGFTYALPKALDLTFVKIRGFTIEYQRSGRTATTTRSRSGVAFSLDADFLALEYGNDKSDDAEPLGWDLVNESPPGLPGGGSAFFNLRYLGIGQHVAFRSTGSFERIADVMSALEGAFVEDDESAEPGTNPLAGSADLVYREDSNWLIGASFDLMGFLSLDAIWNDPDLYGLRIALSGPMAQGFAGLEFEILYRRITDELGQYHIELKLPDAFRRLEFGAVTVTLPVIVVDIFTNGNFKIDLGFPHNGDFSRSFAAEMLPFVGYGGFYFGLLDGETSDRVPVVDNGRFSPVIEVGIGLSIGVGKTFQKGPLEAGVTVTLDTIIEGVIAWFHPDGDSAETSIYYRIDGMARIVGRLYGKVDFKVISASVSVVAYATVTLSIEAHEPIDVNLEVGVRVKASVKIAFVRVRFSFSTTMKYSFSIGSRTASPWHRVSAEELAASSQGVVAAFAADQSIPLDTPAAPELVPVHLSVMFTRILPADADSGYSSRCVALLTIETGADLAASASSDRAARPFSMLAAHLLRALLEYTIVSRASLDQLDTDLANADPEQLEYSWLSDFLTARVTLELGERPVSGEVLEGAVFPMPPELLLSSGDHSVDLSTANAVPEDYLKTERELWAQSAVRIGDESDPASAGSGSLAQIVFRDWFGLVARGLVDRCVECIQAFAYVVEVLPKTRSIRDILDLEPWGPQGSPAAAGLAFLQANRDRPGLMRSGAELVYYGSGGELVPVTIVDGESFGDLATRQGLTLNSLAATGLLETEDLLLGGAELILPDLELVGTEDLIALVVGSTHVDEVAATASRMLFHGLRLPGLADAADTRTWHGLYELLGQQFAMASGTAPKVSLTALETMVSWLKFPGDDGSSIELSVSADESTLAESLRVATLDPIEDLEALAAVEYTPLRFPVERGSEWRHDSGAGTEAQTLLNLPAALIQLLADTGSPAASEAGLGRSWFQLVSGYRPRPTAALSYRAVGAFSWATWIDLRVQPVPSSSGAGAGHGYVLLGADKSGGDRLLQLMTHLEAGLEQGAADIWLLTAANAGSGEAPGFVSMALDPTGTFVLKTNPETATTADDEPLSVTLGASVAEQARLMRLLWEVSTSGRGGFVLRFMSSAGEALPETLFARGRMGKVRMLVRLGSQIVDGAGAPADQAALLDFNNCAILTDAPDPDVDRVAVQARSHRVQVGEDAASVAAALGITEASLREVNADIVDAFANDDQPRVGARLQPAAGLLQPVATLAPGTLGFRLVRDDPTEGSTPDAEPDPEETIDANFSLLACELDGSSEASSSEGGSPVPHFVSSLTEIPCKPVGPVVPEPVGDVDPDDAGDDRWLYEQAIEPYRSLDAAFVSASEPGLPDSASDPYGGIAAGAAVTFLPSWLDLFGNLGPEGASLSVPLRYSDHLQPLHTWSGCSATWEVSRAAQADLPTLTLELVFDARAPVFGLGGSPAQASDARDAMRKQLARVYYQSRSDDIAFSVESSLGAASSSAPASYSLPASRVVDVVRGGLLFLDQLAEASPVSATASAAESLSALADRLVVEPDALMRENEDLAVEALFGATVELERRYRVRPGQTLANILDLLQPDWPSLTAASIADQNGNLPLTAGAVLLGTPGRALTISAAADGSSSTPDALASLGSVSLSGLADALAGATGALVVGAQWDLARDPGGDSGSGASGLHLSRTAAAGMDLTGLAASFSRVELDEAPSFAAAASAAGLSVEVLWGLNANVNAEVLAVGATLTANGQSVEVSGAAASLQAVADQFAALATPVRTTPAGLAAENAELTGLFVAGATVDTGLSLAPVDLLREHAQTAGLLVVGEALTLSEYEVQDGDTLAGLAARFPDHVSAALFPGAAADGDPTPAARANVTDLQDLFAAGQLLRHGSLSIDASAVPETVAELALLYQHTLDELTTNNLGSVLREGAQLRVPGRIALGDTPAELAPVDDADAGKVVASALPTVAAGGASFSEAATQRGVPVVDLAVANATLTGLVDASVAESALGLTPLGGQQTLANLYDRLLEQDEQADFEAMVNDLAEHAGVLVGGASHLMPPPRIDIGVELASQTPGALFAVNVHLVQERTVLERIDERVQDVLPLRRAESVVPPRLDRVDADTGQGGLRAFATGFEAAFEVTEDQAQAQDQTGVRRYQGVKLLSGKEDDERSGLWAARLGASGSAPDDQRYWYSVAQRTPVFYAVKPLATRSISARSAVRPYVAGVGMDTREAPAADSPDEPVVSSEQAFTDIDLDAWARSLLQTIDLVLTPEYALGAYLAAPAAFDDLVVAKQRIAAAVAGRLGSILQASADGSYQVDGDLAAARLALEERLLVRLERAYTIDTLLQVRLDTHGPERDPGQGPAPRLVGALQNVPYEPPDGATLGTVAADLGVEWTYLRGVLEGVPNLFEDGASQDTELVEDSTFKADTALPLTPLRYTVVAGDSAETIADFFDLGLEDLEAATGRSAAELDALAPGEEVRGVDLLPAYTLGSVEVPLDGGVDYMTSFLDVLREGQERKAFLNLDYVIHGLRHRIAEVAEVPGVQRSSWLKFLRPLDAARTVEESDIGQTEIPLPLRDAPEAPVLLRHQALSEPPEDELKGSDFDGWIASLDDWTYELEYSHEMAAQDELRMHVEFGNDVDGDDDDDDGEELALDDDTLIGRLAQFIDALPLLGVDLAQLATVAESEDPTASAGPVEALSWMAGQIADAWQGWTQPVAAPARTVAGHELHEFLVETFLDDEYQRSLDSLRFTSGTSAADGGFSPGREAEALYPAQVDVRVAPPGEDVATHALSLVDQEDADADSVDFRYPTVFDDDGDDIGTPLPAWVRSHALRFTDLDVLQRASARSGMRVTRNADLVTTAPVDLAFVYQSPLVETAAAAQPYVLHTDPIELSSKGSLAQTLGEFFSALFSKAPDATRDASVTAAYCYELVEDTLLSPRVPVLNRTRFAFAGGVDDDPAQSEGFVAELAEALDAWRAEHEPTAPNGCYSLRLVVYDLGDEYGVQRPVLELSDVRVALSQPGADETS